MVKIFGGDIGNGDAFHIQFSGGIELGGEVELIQSLECVSLKLIQAWKVSAPLLLGWHHPTEK